MLFNEIDNCIKVYNNSVIELVQCFGTSFFGRIDLLASSVIKFQEDSSVGLPTGASGSSGGHCNRKMQSRTVSGTVSTSLLTLEMTVMCIPEPEIVQPKAATQGALPPDTINETVAGFDTSTPAVATPATVVGKPDPQVKGLSDTPSVRVLRLASVVRTILLVFLTHAAVGHSRGLAAYVFTQPGAGGALSERFG